MTTFDLIRNRLKQAIVHGMFLTDQERRQLDQEMNDVLKSIAKCESLDLAESLLEELGQMQLTLATLRYRHKIDLTGPQERLVKEYDRWDLHDIRSAAYEAIRQGQFP